MFFKIIFGAIVGIGAVVALNAISPAKKAEEVSNPGNSDEKSEKSKGEFAFSNVTLTETDKYILEKCHDTNFLNQYFARKSNNKAGNNDIITKISAVQETVSKIKSIMDLVVTVGVDLAKLLNFNNTQQCRPPETGWQPNGVYLFR